MICMRDMHALLHNPFISLSIMSLSSGLAQALEKTGTDEIASELEMIKQAWSAMS